MKNTHLEHLEDNILNGGSQGGKEAVAFLRSLGDMLDQGGADTRVTVKWDGAPAIICGVNPENGRFFVGTKSVFNKVSPKISYSESDVENMYPPGQLAENSIFNVIPSVNVITKSCFDPPASLATIDVAASSPACN